ncbi:unnamed protein product [Ilex paraguariensis]|uniref:Uncharacterized protein n=1 Tax=Ilex paraguariensis TaxID=185542 RepID=A0ABC8RAI1_9AQUA
MLSEKNVEANDIPKKSEVIEISSDEESDNSYYMEHVKAQNLKRSSSLMNGMDDQNQSSLPKRLRLQDFPAEASAAAEKEEINHQDDSDTKE